MVKSTSELKLHTWAVMALLKRSRHPHLTVILAELTTVRILLSPLDAGDEHVSRLAL
jgi:hypothetical protein